MTEVAVHQGPSRDDTVRSTTLRELADRADRARAQAVANCQALARAMSRTRAFEPSVDGRVRHGSVDAEDRVREMQETIDGLLKRIESQGPIEQAKGIIMAQTHCTADQAFEILRRASQRSNTKLRLLALDLVAKTSRTEVPS
jgi:ANTAR domain